MKQCVMRGTHRLFALLLCAAMLLMMLPLSAKAVSQSEISKVLGYYSGGTKSSTLEYDCGNGVTGGGEKSYLTIVTDTSASNFSSFQTKLKNAGYTVQTERKVSSNASDDNSFGSYLAPDGSYRVYAYHFPGYKETRIIVDTEQRTVNGFTYEPQAGVSVEPKYVLWGLPMSINGYGAGEKVSPDHFDQRNCGAMVVIRMPDNSLFIHDGGDVQQWNDEACDEFVRFCRELTGISSGKMVINTWFLSHAHVDHFQGFYRLMNKKHGDFELKNIMYNIDVERSKANYDLTGVLGMLRGFYPDVQYYKPHTGELLDIAGVKLDVIYAHEDRYLPNSSNKLIVDTDNQGGTYRSDMYKSSGASDFNDTSTVLKVIFPNGVSSIIYADMNLAETVLLKVYPDSVLKTDIMMVPHHGHNTHTELVNKADSRVYLYTQHKGAVYGPDNDVSTLDIYGTYRESVRDKFIAMFPGMYVPAGTENVDYDIFWAGNETVTIDVNKLGKSASNYYTTQPAMSFAYTGWGILDESSDPVLPADVLVGVSDPVTEDAVQTTTNTNRFNPVDSGALADNARYVIMHKQSGNIMSYDAVAVTPGRPNKATSLYQVTTTPLDSTASNIYYLNEKGVYIAHSNRANAMWILNQEGTATDAELSDGSGDGGVGPWFGGKAYGEVWLNKGNATEWNSDGSKGEGRNGVYWNAVYGEDNASTPTQYRYLDPRYADEEWVTTSAPTGTDSSNPKKRYIIEDLGNGEFLVYWSSVSGNTVGFLTCDENGNWGVKKFTDGTDDFDPAVPGKNSEELEALKLKFYQYKVFTDVKSISFNGPKEFNVIRDASAELLLGCIQENIVLKDMNRWEMGVECSGTTPRIGYYYLKFDSAYPTEGKNQYKVNVLYRNDDNTDTMITSLSVNMVDQTLEFAGKTSYTATEGDEKETIVAQIVNDITVTSTVGSVDMGYRSHEVEYSAVPSAGCYWLEFSPEYDPELAGEASYDVYVNYRQFGGEDVLVKTLNLTVESDAAGTIDVKSASLNFEDEILVNLYFITTDLNATEMGLLTWSKDPGEGTIDNAEQIYVGAEYDEETDRYMVQTDGIAAKKMGDDIYMRVYAKTRRSIVYSKVVTYSPKKYAMSRLEKSTSETMKALCVAMLNYGAAAQKYFGYKTDSLANADLSQAQRSLVAPYDSSLFAGAQSALPAKARNFPKTDGFSKRTATVSFEGAFAINYYFTPSLEVDGDVMFYYWNAEDYARPDVLTIENVTGVESMVPSGDGRYWMEISGIAAKQLDDTFYVAAIYTDTEGVGHCTGIVSYSLSKYCINNAEGDMGELAQATAMYGYYAKTYLAA